MSKPSAITTSARGAIDDLAEQWRLSLPFGGSWEGQPVIAIFAYQAIPRPGKPSVIYPPSHVIYLKPGSAEFLHREKIVSSTPANESIGSYGIPDGMDYEGYLTMEQEIHGLVFDLWPALAGEKQVPASLRKKADDFHSKFGRLAEQDLKPYYLKYGGEFFKLVSMRPEE